MARQRTITLSRYLLFMGKDYYPSGGMEDLRHSAPTIEACRLYFQRHRPSWASGMWGHIVDRRTLRIVKRLDHCKELDEVMVATSTKPIDDPIYNLAWENGIRCFRAACIFCARLSACVLFFVQKNNPAIVPRVHLTL